MKEKVVQFSAVLDSTTVSLGSVGLYVLCESGRMFVSWTSGEDWAAIPLPETVDGKVVKKK